MKLPIYSLFNGFVKYSIAFTKKQFKQALKQYAVPSGVFAYAGKTSFTAHSFYGTHAECIVFIDKKYFKKQGKENVIYSLIAHEAVHVKQQLMKVMDDECPSSDFEAFIVEEIVENFVNQYLATK